MRRLSISLFCCLLVCLAEQQPPPTFEVASIKPVDLNAPHMVGINIYPGGRVVISGLSLKALAGAAFHLSYWQISGGETWTDTDQVNIEAKPPDDLQPPIRDLRHTLFGMEDERLRQMLQALLIDRFQLKFHRETKTGDVYLLERSSRPLGLHLIDRPAERESFGSIGYANGRWVLTGTSMPQLASFASSNLLHTPVLDRTELPGSFEYRQLHPDTDPNYADNSSSFLALLGEVGLKLQRTKGPVETFVIDHASKPTPN